VSAKLNSNSKLRVFFFNLRRSMILQPFKGIIINIVAGFIVNIQLMLSVVIIFEKVSAYFSLKIHTVEKQTLFITISLDILRSISILKEIFSNFTV
jgi:archaellum biogenesis protein FlaJ (TadC family)